MRAAKSHNGPAYPQYQYAAFTRFPPRFRLLRLRRWQARLLKLIIFLALLTLLATLHTIVFRPSYVHLPAHYRTLESRISASSDLGRGNVNSEKVFVTISLHDRGGALLSSWYGAQLVDLIHLLGPDNVVLSIYLNDDGHGGAEALERLRTSVRCTTHFTVETSFDDSSLPELTLPDGERVLKRLVYLSAVRNRALAPLYSYSKGTFNKVLFLNDVAFRPVDAAHLLFSTNHNNYVSACAMDFEHLPTKFYDIFATRDAQGYEMGEIWYPFFSNAGSGFSRKDVFSESDAVRVRSCWGGMAAFDARYLFPLGVDESQNGVSVGNVGELYFRAETGLFYDACECCLFQADVIERSKGRFTASPYREHDVGVYVNPFVRVAYEPGFLYWARLFRYVERIFTPTHTIANWRLGLPRYNPYRELEIEGKKGTFEEEVWVVNKTMGKDAGTWQVREAESRPGLYCGIREMYVMRRGGKGFKSTNWRFVDVPRGGIFEGKGRKVKDGL